MLMFDLRFFDVFCHTGSRRPLMDRNVQANVAQGQRDTPELRAAVKQELVARELMAQEAQKRGLDKLPATQEALTAMR